VTTTEATAKYPDADGIVSRLKADGFALIAQHGGAGGWREIEGRVCYVDYFGGVWSLPQGNERSQAEVEKAARDAGAVSHAAVVELGEHFRN
jgi:hypothetical protein